MLISKREVSTNICIAVAGLAGYPSSSRVGGVAIFQVSWAKWSIMCSCSK